MSAATRGGLAASLFAILATDGGVALAAILAAIGWAVVTVGAVLVRRRQRRRRK